MENKIIGNDIIAGTLYVVATPIGNLLDISQRALYILKNVDLIACEDTRVTRKLLTHYNINTKTTSYFQHTEKSKMYTIIDKLTSGSSVALVSDAGTPAISDPGEELVKECLYREISIKAIPGPSAAISALSVSGQDTSKFIFIGFLSAKSTKRLLELEEIANLTYTLVFYEAPHKLLATLIDMRTIFGNRNISIIREISKIYEEIIKDNLENIISLYENKNPKGEFVIIVEGKHKENNLFTLNEAVSLLKIKIEQDHLPLSQASKMIAKITGIKKADIYKSYLENQ